MPIKALFFDVGNTLLFANRERMLRPLHERGVFPSDELLQEIERNTKHEFDALQEKNSAVDHGYVQIYYSQLLDRFSVPDEAICHELVTHTRISANWCDIRPGTREI